MRVSTFAFGFCFQEYIRIECETHAEFIFWVLITRLQLDYDAGKNNN